MVRRELEPELAELELVTKGCKGRAISLRTLQEELRHCVKDGNCPEEVFRCYGLKKIRGLIIDEHERDIVLFGALDDFSPALHLDDFVVALRNVWKVYAKRKGNTYFYASPACSIDPSRETWRALGEISDKSSGDWSSGKEISEWKEMCAQPQQVKVLGVPFDSRFARVMVEADYYLKRLLDGSVSLDLQGFKSFPEIVAKRDRESMKNGHHTSVPPGAFNRFWFCSDESTFVEDHGMVLISDSKVKVVTEQRFLDREGKTAASGKVEPTAEEFARQFSEEYPEIARRKPIYAELESLYRFMSFATIMETRKAVSKARLSLDYLLYEYPLQNTPVDRTLPGVARVPNFEYRTETEKGTLLTRLWIPMCGGVGVDPRPKILGQTDKSGTVGEDKRSILQGRPSTKPELKITEPPSPKPIGAPRDVGTSWDVHLRSHLGSVAAYPKIDQLQTDLSFKRRELGRTTSEAARPVAEIVSFSWDVFKNQLRELATNDIPKSWAEMELGASPEDWELRQLHKNWVPSGGSLKSELRPGFESALAVIEELTGQFEEMKEDFLALRHGHISLAQSIFKDFDKIPYAASTGRSLSSYSEPQLRRHFLEFSEQSGGTPTKIFTWRIWKDYGLVEESARK